MTTLAHALLAAALLIIPSSVLAQRPAPESAGVREVRRGDTLWDLAGECLGNPYRWPEIYRLNTGIVADPDLIYPLESLRLPPCVPGAPAAVAARGAAGASATGAVPSRSIFYRDDADRLGRGTIADELITAAPLTTSGEFYRAGVLVHDREIASVGTVEGVRSPTVVPIRSAPQIQPNDRIYLRLASGVKEGDRLHLLRPDREIRPYGRIYLSTGIATVESVRAGTAVLVVDQLFDQVRRGDVAVPLADFQVPEGETLSPAWGPSGRILAFATPSPVRQLHDLAFVDLGRQFGVREGDELEVYLPETRESWGVRPEVRVALLRVVRSTERTATAQVIGMEQPALEAGLPVRVISRSP